MKKTTTGRQLVTAAAAAVAIAAWSLSAAPDGPGPRPTTASAVALMPEVARHDLVAKEGPKPALSAAEKAEAEGRAAREREARRVEREREAVAALRIVARVQELLQESAVIDTDGDSLGEHGYLGELMGITPVRKSSSDDLSRPVLAGDLLDPPFLANDFGVLTIVGAHAAVRRGAYYLQVHLPDRAQEPPIGAVTEAPGGGVERVLPGGFAEVAWCCYAWPADTSDGPLGTFFVNQAGVVLVCDGMQSPYAGNVAPRFDAALSDALPGDLLQPLGLAAEGRRANDGLVWTEVRY